MKLTRKFLIDNLLGVDRVIHCKNGMWKFRRSFFYRHGMSAEKLADDITKQLSALGYEFELNNNSEIWNAWPKESYFEASGFQVINR